MEKIEVEITPVRIVEKQTTGVTNNTRPENEIGLIPLKLKLVIPKTELSDGQEYVHKDAFMVEVPEKYVGYLIYPSLQPLEKTYHFYLSMQFDEYCQKVSETGIEQEIILTLLPNLDNVESNATSIDAPIRDIYGVPEFNNVPTVYFGSNGKFVDEVGFANTQLNRSSQVSSRFERLFVLYKGENFNSIGWRLSEQGYTYKIEADYADGRTETKWVGDRLGYWDIEGLVFDYNNLPSAVYFVFKHNDREWRTQIFDISNQPAMSDQSDTNTAHNSNYIDDDE